MLGSLFYRILRTAAEKLALRIDPQTLTISDTDGSKVKNLSRRLKLEVTNIETNLTAREADAYVLDNITSDTPALQWSELKKIWPYLSSIPNQRVAKPGLTLLVRIIPVMSTAEQNALTMQKKSSRWEGGVMR